MRATSMKWWFVMAAALRSLTRATRQAARPLRSRWADVLTCVVKSTDAGNRFAVRYFGRPRSLQPQVACARASHGPISFSLAGWLRQFGYSRWFAGRLFSGVRRRDLTNPGRNGYSGGRSEPILRGSFENTPVSRLQLGLLQLSLPDTADKALVFAMHPR
jgi:hypothetical protein